MKIGDRVHLYSTKAYNARGMVVAIGERGTHLTVRLDSGREVTCPACDAERV